MASGRVHARNAHAVIWTSIPISAAFALTGDPQAIAGIGGAIVGWLVEPDLDLHNVTTRSENRMYKVNPALGYVWELFWYPLARLIPHGSPFSHFPPLCTAIRLAYVCLVVFLVSCALTGPHAAQEQAQAVWLWYRLNWQSARWIYWGFGWWAFQDFVHLAADGFKIKQWTKRRRPRRRKRAYRKRRHRS